MTGTDSIIYLFIAIISGVVVLWIKNIIRKPKTNKTIIYNHYELNEYNSENDRDKRMSKIIRNALNERYFKEDFK